VSALDSLCVLPPGSPQGCCAQAAPDAVSTRPSNPPGLSAVRYRIGTFTSFRRAMFTALPAPDLIPGAPNPFAIWREGSDSDYQTMFIEIWAYLADILTFYQERIANEAFLPTATQVDSMSRIAALIGYHPAPGSGASGTVAFTVAKNKTVNIPASFRVGSKAQPASDGSPAKAAAVFESDRALVALDEHNAIPLSPVAPTNQFAPLASFGTFFGPTVVDPATLATVATDLYGEAAPIYVSTFPSFRNTALLAQQAAVFQAASASSGAAHAHALAKALAAPTVNAAKAEVNFGAQTSDIFTTGFIGVVGLAGFLNPPPQAAGFTYNPFTDDITRTIVFRGLNLGIKVGDQLLAVANEAGTDPHKEIPTLHQVIAVSSDKASNTTTVQWVEAPNQTYDVSAKDVNVYRFAVEAGVFGNAAPQFLTIPTELTKSGAAFDGVNWDDPSNPWFSLPKPDEASQSQVFLDGVYDKANGTPQNPGWAVLMTDSPPDPFIAHVVDARAVSRAAYATSAKITRLTFLPSEKIPTTPPVFPVRTTVALCGSQLLELQNNLPLPQQVSGDTIILAGVHKQLQAGQAVILTGPVFSDPAPATPVTNSELRTIKTPPSPSDQFGITTVILDRPLDQTYTRADSALLANIVSVTQGETVKDEILGSGDGTEQQSFPLKKSPLTYLPSTDPQSFAAVESTLKVTVNGVAWQELPTLLESQPNDQVYTTTRDSQNETTVVFGDGFHGSRPSSGVDNIHARYRKGLGSSGNVDPGGVQQLVDSAPGLQQVVNPLATSGGADPEDVGGIRRNAPPSVRAFGRAVSAEDYASLALTFPGVGKASSVWVTRTGIFEPAIHPYVQLTVAAANQLPLAAQPTLASKLRRFLDQRRDPNVSLRIVDFTPVPLDAAIAVDLDDRFPRSATLASAQGAAAAFFAFDNLDFGESIHLSSLYAALLAVPGVIDANVTTLRRVDAAGSDRNVEDTIFIQPTEIASVDTPGSLIVTLGEGGFADQ
jgi:uncharacterized phage protein gp47/JayE